MSNKSIQTQKKQNYVFQNVHCRGEVCGWHACGISVCGIVFALENDKVQIRDHLKIVWLWTIFIPDNSGNRIPIVTKYFHSNSNLKSQTWYSRKHHDSFQLQGQTANKKIVKNKLTYFTFPLLAATPKITPC